MTPGVVRGAIDREALPKVSSVALYAKGVGPFGGDFAQQLDADDSEYEIRNVPPGSYQLQVYGEATRTGNEGFRRDVVQRHEVEVKSSETLTFNLGGIPAEK